MKNKRSYKKRYDFGGLVGDVGKGLLQGVTLGAYKPKEWDTDFGLKFMQHYSNFVNQMQSKAVGPILQGMMPQSNMPNVDPSMLTSAMGGTAMASGATAAGTAAIGAGTSMATVGAAALSDKRAKANIKPIGMTFDGQPIYKYNYKGSPKTEIGLMAQDVEKVNKNAVGNYKGLKTVNYDLATKNAELYQGGGWVNTGKNKKMWQAEGHYFTDPQQYVRWKHKTGEYKIEDEENLFGEIMSTPQKMANYLTGGKYEKPSGTVENVVRNFPGYNGISTEGKILTDAVLDPLNAVLGFKGEYINLSKKWDEIGTINKLAKTVNVANGADLAQDLDRNYSSNPSYGTRKGKFQGGEEVIIPGKKINPPKVKAFSNWDPTTWGLYNLDEFKGDESLNIDALESAKAWANRSGQKRFMKDNQVFKADEYDEADFKRKAQTNGFKQLRPNQFKTYRPSEDDVKVNDYSNKNLHLSPIPKEMIIDVKKAADKAGIDPYLLLSVIGKESSFTQRSGSDIEFISDWETLQKDGVEAQYFTDQKVQKRFGPFPYYKNKHGYQFDDIKGEDQQKRFNELLDYSDSLKAQNRVNDFSLPFEKSARSIKEKGDISKWNPGQKNYKDMVMKNYETLKKMNLFQAGGNVNTEDMLPYNQEHLDDVSENLVKFDGPSHDQGGIKTPAGEFDRQETVLKPGVVGNKDPFAFSDNLILSKEIVKELGLPNRFSNKTIAQASKLIENKYESNYKDLSVTKNTKDIMKQSLYSKLMMANRLENLKNRQENGIQSKEDLTFSELNKFQSGGPLTDSSRGALSISPEQAIAIAKQRGFGQLSVEQQIRAGNNIYANELAAEQRSINPTQMRDKAKLSQRQLPEIEMQDESNPFSKLDVYSENNTVEVDPTLFSPKNDSMPSFIPPQKKVSYQTVQRGDLDKTAEAFLQVKQNPKLFQQTINKLQLSGNEVSELKQMLGTENINIPQPVYKKTVDNKYKSVTNSNPVKHNAEKKVEINWNEQNYDAITKAMNKGYKKSTELQTSWVDQIMGVIPKADKKAVNEPSVGTRRGPVKSTSNQEGLKRLAPYVDGKADLRNHMASEILNEMGKGHTYEEAFNKTKLKYIDWPAVEDVPLNMKVFLNEDKQTSYYNKKEKLEKKEKEYQDKLFAIKLEKQINDYGLEIRNKYNIEKAVETLQKAQYYPQTDYRGIPKNIKKHGGPAVVDLFDIKSVGTRKPGKPAIKAKNVLQLEKKDLKSKPITDPDVLQSIEEIRNITENTKNNMQGYSFSENNLSEYEAAKIEKEKRAKLEESKRAFAEYEKDPISYILNNKESFTEKTYNNVLNKHGFKNEDTKNTKYTEDTPTYEKLVKYINSPFLLPGDEKFKGQNDLIQLLRNNPFKKLYSVDNEQNRKEYKRKIEELIKQEGLSHLLEEDNEFKLGGEVNKYQGGEEVELPWNSNTFKLSLTPPSVPLRKPKIGELPEDYLDFTDSDTDYPNPSYGAKRIQKEGVPTAYQDPVNPNLSWRTPNNVDLPRVTANTTARNLEEYAGSTQSNTNNINFNNFSGKDKKDFLSQLSALDKAGFIGSGLGMLGQAATMMKKETVPTNYNPYKHRIDNMISSRLNSSYQPMYNRLNAEANSALDRDSSRSINVQRGLNNNTYATKMQKLSELGLVENGQKNKMILENANILNNLGAQDVQARNIQEDLQARTTGARRQGLRGLMANSSEQFSNTVFSQSFANKTAQDMLKWMGTIAPDFKIDANTLSEMNELVNDPDAAPIVALFKSGYTGEDSKEILVKQLEELNSKRAAKGEKPININLATVALDQKLQPDNKSK